MSELKFTKEHEWIRVEGEVCTIGVSDHAQEQLGDVVYVELPAVGKACKKGDELAVVESVKAASEIYAPVSGEVIEVNDALVDDPGQVNADATGTGWFVKMRIGAASELEGLMDESAYKDYLETIS